jgi:hypothetical protein
MIASAASITWASTQPPIVTPPRSRPLSPTTILAPIFFEVLPLAATSVASATALSSLRSRSSIRACVVMVV